MRAKGKDSCRSTKQLILSPGGIFYGRYNLQDASLKATRVYQRKLVPLHPRSPFRDPSFVSRRIFLFRLRLTVASFSLTAPEPFDAVISFGIISIAVSISPLPHRFRIYLSKISRVHFVTHMPRERTASVVVRYLYSLDVFETFTFTKMNLTVIFRKIFHR